MQAVSNVTLSRACRLDVSMHSHEKITFSIAQFSPNSMALLHCKSNAI